MKPWIVVLAITLIPIAAAARRSGPTATAPREVHHSGLTESLPLQAQTNTFPEKLQIRLRLDRPRIIRAYAQATFLDQSRPSIVGTSIYVGKRRLATAFGVADHGVNRTVPTQRTLKLGPGHYTVSVQVQAQFDSTSLFGNSLADATFLNVEVE